jgi:fructose-1,6-bisphosphatase
MSASENSIVVPQENELGTLTNFIIEWQRLKEETTDMRQVMREKNKKMKAIEEVIVRIMKSNNIGALDLKNSGGRLLFKKKKCQSGLGQKNMLKLMAEHMQSMDKATELIKYIQDNRTTVTKESIQYEKN